MWNWIKQLFISLANQTSQGHDLNELARRLDVAPEQLNSIDRSYREFSIKKRGGGRRQIAEPNPDLKRMQRRILKRLLKKLKTHPQATGFQPGMSFVDNANCHAYQEVVIRMDLVDFFPSITQAATENYFRKIGWNREAARVLSQLTTHQGCLPQGAPTSPRLSNLVNYFLDCSLARIAQRHGAIYTRYADDLTFSLTTDTGEVADLISKVSKVLRDAGYNVHQGRKRYRVLRRHHRQLVTGLVVNEGGRLPRKTRRWLRAVEHRMQQANQGGYFGPRPTLAPSQLEGWRALQIMIDRGRE